MALPLKGRAGSPDSGQAVPAHSPDGDSAGREGNRFRASWGVKCLKTLLKYR